jgi:hypothetical protein
MIEKIIGTTLEAKATPRPDTGLTKTSSEVEPSFEEIFIRQDWSSKTFR